MSDAGYPCISDPGSILVKKAIENNIKVSYEVLLYDNREKDNSDLNIHNYEILGQNGKNEFQLKAKSELIKNAKGEYIWFVDADDDICFIPKRLESLTFNIVYSSFI